MATKKLYAYGLKWWDKVNGNTYHTPLIYDEEMHLVLKGRFQYGYGNQYMTSAKEELEANGYTDYKLYDMGSHYTTKKNAKNGWRE